MARVTIAVVAALPTGTVRPIADATTPITTGVGWSPITIQPRPATVHAALLSTAGLVDLAASTPPADPTMAPTEYAVSPIVASRTPRPVSCPNRARPRVKANHAAHPTPRTVQPVRISGCSRSRPRTCGISSILDFVRTEDERGDDHRADDGQHSFQRHGRSCTDDRDQRKRRQRRERHPDADVGLLHRQHLSRAVLGVASVTDRRQQRAIQRPRHGVEEADHQTRSDHHDRRQHAEQRSGGNEQGCHPLESEQDGERTSGGQSPLQGAAPPRGRDRRDTSGAGHEPDCPGRPRLLERQEG